MADEDMLLSAESIEPIYRGTVVLRLVRRVSLMVNGHYSWTLVENDGELIARKAVWDDNAAHIVIRDKPLKRSAISKHLDQLPPVPLGFDSAIGRDGTTTELIVERGFHKLHITWWSMHPPQWQALVEWTDDLEKALDGNWLSRLGDRLR